jgi:predicted outer membrane repeat protein
VALGLLITSLLLLLPRLRAATIHVPGDYSTIQEAVNAASPGDEVLVADGTYSGPGNMDVEITDQGISIRSENGPESCIIDCELVGRAFYIHDDWGLVTVIEGFTIINGSVPDSGGAILCERASPVISNCVLTGNAATGNGGALQASFSDIEVRGCTISGNAAGMSGGGIAFEETGAPSVEASVIVENTAIDGQGGGILLLRCSPTIASTKIASNTASAGGAGIFSDQSVLLLRRSVVKENVAGSETSLGAGIHVIAGQATIVNSAIERNRNATRGGGLAATSSAELTLAGTVVTANSAASVGGGIALDGATAQIYNSIMADNETVHDGGGVACHGSSSIEIYHSVIRGNRSGANYSGGGLYADIDQGSVTLANCLITENNAGNGPGGGLRFASLGQAEILACTIAGNVASGTGGLFIDGPVAAVTMENSIVWGNSFPDVGGDLGALSGTYTLSPSGVSQGWCQEGCTEEDPMFVEGPCGGNYMAHLAAGDPADSPAIDAGSRPAENACYPDFAGETCLSTLTTRRDSEPDQGTVDLGYHARTGDTVLVDDDAPGDPAPGDPIIGDPLEDGSAEHPYDAIEEGILAAHCPDVVQVADGEYRGRGNHDLNFWGKSIVVRAAPEGDGATIDCAGSPERYRRAFLFRNGEDPRVVVEGFTIINGHTDTGGAIACSNNSAPTIRACTFSGNSAATSGGAIAFQSADQPLRIEDCTFELNHAGAQRGVGGGALYTAGSASFLSSIFRQNSASGRGGALVVQADAGLVELIGCTFTRNTVGDGSGAGSGGAIWSDYGNTLRIIDSLLEENVAHAAGGAFQLQHALSGERLAHGRSGKRWRHRRAGSGPHDPKLPFRGERLPVSRGEHRHRHPGKLPPGGHHILREHGRGCQRRALPGSGRIPRREDRAELHPLGQSTRSDQCHADPHRQLLRRAGGQR